MSSDTYKEGVEKLTLPLLTHIRDFVLIHGIPKNPGRFQMQIRLNLNDDEEDLVFITQISLTHVQMRVSLGDETPPEHYHIVVFEGENNCLFLDKEVNPSDLITLSMAIEAGYSIFDSQGDSEPN